MSDFDDTNNGDSFDDDGFDNVARRAGRGLGGIASNRPAASTVRKRVARRRVTMLGSVAGALVVAVVAVSASNNSNGTGPKISIATSPSSTPSTTVEDPTTTTETVPDSVGVTTSITPTTGVLTTTTTAPPATTTTLQLLQITVYTPTPGMSVPAAGPMLVSGKALTFESTVNIKIYDDRHNLILETFTMSASQNAEPGPYSISIEFPSKVTAPNGTLEVFEYSAKDGAEIHKVIVPITFTA